jgi:hypothetical protein
MPSFKLTLNSAIAANLFSVLRGEQTGAGITVAPAVDPKLNGAWSSVTIQNATTSSGPIRVGGVNMPADGSSGLEVAVGENAPFTRDRVRHAIGNTLIVATVDGAIINIDLE